MRRAWLAAVAILAGAVGPTWGAEPDEPLLAHVPPGVFVKSTTVVPGAQRAAIGQRLGGRIERLTNSMLQVQGRAIQVNVVTAVDDASARAIFARLSSIKPPGFCVRKGNAIVEYVGRDVDAALATKTSYELGLVPKPDRVTYRVVAELGTVDRGSDATCNVLFNQFLALGQGSNPEAARQIETLTKGFTFGRTLRLRNPKGSLSPTSYRVVPEATGRDDKGSVTAYSFGTLPKRHGVPYVVATLEVTVNGDGLRPDTTTPDRSLTAPTSYWPADDAEVIALARRITAGKTTHEAKAEAILAWLAPGTNLKYSGETGSRWGVSTVLAQKFGRCWDFSDVFVTLARASGVPSRAVAGWLHGSSGHVWAEYHRPGKGWQQVDPTGGGTLGCGIYHIPYFSSDDGFMPILYLAMPRIEARPASGRSAQ